MAGKVGFIGLGAMGGPMARNLIKADVPLVVHDIDAAKTAPNAGLPPEWFADFLRYMAQMRLDANGELETLSPADWIGLGQRLRNVLHAKPTLETPYLRIVRQYVPD